ncbi:hypothetical protein DCAR_0416602 [Daucus carota subsp. sativus]|uniref:Uncharacterized protein n=1 Tax=Daucus carota subsp. sativus TaxID=79200 RepID=A0A165XMH5_DAUCS|nr:hypothetical protein DCAR_0416602 [Daucus carota subsp. sativus]
MFESIQLKLNKLCMIEGETEREGRILEREGGMIVTRLMRRILNGNHQRCKL